MRYATIFYRTLFFYCLTRKPSCTSTYIIVLSHLVCRGSRISKRTIGIEFCVCYYSLKHLTVAHARTLTLTLSFTRSLTRIQTLKPFLIAESVIPKSPSSWRVYLEVVLIYRFLIKLLIMKMVVIMVIKMKSS